MDRGGCGQAHGDGQGQNFDDGLLIRGTAACRRFLCHFVTCSAVGVAVSLALASRGVFALAPNLVQTLASKRGALVLCLK